MSTQPDPDAPYGFDLRSPTFLADPYPVYARLRAEAPVTFIDQRWVVSRYDDVAAVLTGPSFGRGDYDYVLLRAFGPGPLFDTFSRWMVFMDPPDHTRLRRLVMHAFTPRAVERLRAAIQGLVDRLLDDLGKQGGGDLVSSFAYPLPVMVICELLGVPADDRGQFGAWSACIGRALQVGAMTPQIIRDGNAATAQLTEYFRKLIVAQRQHARESLLGDLIAARSNGERLSEQELLATVGLLFFAGHETTVNLIGNGALALLQHRTQWQRLYESASLAPRALEEVLRFESPVQLASRVARTDSDVSGVSIRAGEVVTVLIGSANRDPHRFVEPDRFDICRSDTHHLAFAIGPHYCLGATLARLEGEVAISSLVRRFPDLRLTCEEVAWRQNNLLRGLHALEVAC